MHTITHLRKVGGSIMLAVPPAILELLHLEAGATLDLAIDDGRLVIVPIAKPRYSLEELIAQCDSSSREMSEEDREWLDAKPRGKELLNGTRRHLPGISKSNIRP